MTTSATASTSTTVGVIVTYQGERFLRPLFESLRAHTAPGALRYVIVDNASTDGTDATVRDLQRAWPEIDYLPQTRNTGFAEGNNIGIKRARETGAERILLLNQDLEVTAGWLPPLHAALDERPDVAAAQPLILLFDEPEIINTAGNALHFCGFGYCGGYRQPRADYASRAPYPVAFGSGAALLLRGSALDEVGAFDETFFLYHEDCDLGVRLRQRGWDTLVVPQSQVFHKYRASFSPAKFAFLERNRWYLLLKDWPLGRLLGAAPALAAVELAVLASAAKNGWLKHKLASYVEVVKALPWLARARRQTQEQRSAKASDARYLVGELVFDGFDHPIITKVANPVLTAYWNLLRRLEG